MGLGSKEKSKLNFLKVFDNPLSKYLILKKILAFNGCFRLFTKIKRGLPFGAYVSYLILYQRTKFQCHTFFYSQYIKPNVLSNLLFRQLMMS